MADLQLNLLGPPAIEYEGHTIRLEMRKTLALLAYLSLSPQRRTRETLANLFWPEYDQQRSLSNLRRNLSSLSKSLPFAILETDRETIGICQGDPIKVDANEFQALVDFTNKHSHSVEKTCPECLAHLEKAISLYRGDFFEGFNLKDCPEFDEWQFLQRESLRSQYAGALEKLAEYYASQCQWERAISRARSWLALDRLHEPAQRLLIFLLAQSGQRQAALHQYEGFVRILRDEQGQEPGDQLADLIQKIREGQEAPQKRSGELLSPKPPPARPVEPLLKTKIYIPFRNREQVFRESVIRRLNGISEYPLTIVSAPAGFGKTTALTEWIKQSSLLVGWISLDDADNHLERFLTYFIAAVRSVQSEFGEGISPLLYASQPQPTQVVVSHLIYELEKILEPFVLILDDYHLIRSGAVNEVVSFILDHLPYHVHMVISTRADPALNLALLRSRGQLLEIRTKDLRFSAEETLAYLNDVMRLGISVEESALLGKRTEGWAAGLQMAALSLLKQPDKSQTIRAFSGSNRYILDYLLEQVIERQPKYIQDFLLQTSILEQVNGRLCDAVTEIKGWNIKGDGAFAESEFGFSSQQVLEYLERVNLFVLAVDDDRCWYRYHQLFAELLAARLRYLHPDLVEGLHKRASAWYEQNSMMMRAMYHAWAARDMDRLAHLLEKNALEMISGGETAILMEWLDKLPKEFINERVDLLRAKIWGLCFSGKMNLAEPLLDKLEALLDGQEYSDISQFYSAEINLLRGVAANYACEFSRSADLCCRALELLAGKSPRTQTIGILTLGHVYYALGDYDRAEQEFSKAGIIAKELDSWTLVQSICERSILDAHAGKLHRAKKRLEEAYQLMEVESGLLPGSIAMVDSGMARLLIEWNQLDDAQKLLSRSVGNIDWSKSMRWWESPNMIVPGYLLWARLYRLQGDLDRASEVIEKAFQLMTQFDIYPTLRIEVEAERVNQWLAQGDLVNAQNWAEDHRLTKSQPRSPYLVKRWITLARVLLATGKNNEAEQLLDRLSVTAERQGHYGRLIEILALQALALRSGNNTSRAIDVLKKALLLAEPEGYIRVFVNEGEPMRLLLAQWLAHNDDNRLLRAYAISLLSNFDPKPQPAPVFPENALQYGDLVEPLSGRELEVLHLLALGRTNQEIAQQLIIAPGTVKAHTASIYRKLEVTNRTEAVARARQIGRLK